MSKGKFEADRRQRAPARTGASARTAGTAAGRTAPARSAFDPNETVPSGRITTGTAAARRSANYRTKKKKNQSRLPLVVALISVLAVTAVVLLVLRISGKLGPGSDQLSNKPYQPQGMTRELLEEKAARAAEALRTTDLVLTLQPEGYEPALTPVSFTGTGGVRTLTDVPRPAPQATEEKPIVLTLTPAQTGADLNLEALRADLDAGKGKVADNDYVVDLADYLTLNRSVLDRLAADTAAEYGKPFSDPVLEVVNDGPSSDATDSDEPIRVQKTLVIRTGVIGRSIDEPTVSRLLNDAYSAAARGDYLGLTEADLPGSKGGSETAEETEPAEEADPAETEDPFHTVFVYQYQLPQPIDLDSIYNRYCTEPQDARYDAATQKIVDDMPGYGFEKERVLAMIYSAGEGEELRIPLVELQAQMTAERLRESLFRDTLAQVDTKHSWNMPRTNNLILACKEINGTVVQPGEIFSFNKVVGERTAEKGYQEAIAYVSGGASKPELGGGICQVASSIYYAVLLADLTPVERYEHMYLVTYVPEGMDAAIYWGVQDFKFKNTSPYPLRIDASVSGGKVHITLVGTEWKDYTIEMSFEINEVKEYDTVTKDYPPSSGFK